MAILTQKMVTAKKAYMGGNCKTFFPFNEGSGTLLGEIVDGDSITDSGATHLIPHTISAYSVTTVDSSVAMNPKKSWVVAYQRKIVGLTIFDSLSLGGAGSGVQKVTMDQNGGDILVSNSSIGTISDTATTWAAGDICFTAIAYDAATGIATFYDTKDAGSLSTGNSVDISAGKGVEFRSNTPPSVLGVSFSSASSRQDNYGIAFHIFDDVLPSDLTVALKWLSDNWAKGHKQTYPGWKDLS